MSAEGAADTVSQGTFLSAPPSLADRAGRVTDFPLPWQANAEITFDAAAGRPSVHRGCVVGRPAHSAVDVTSNDVFRSANRVTL